MKCFRFWKALFEAGVFTNPVIPPAVEPGHALLRTSYMATHTDEQLDRVLEHFERSAARWGSFPARPTTFIAVKIARPGTYVMSNEASQVGSGLGRVARRPRLLARADLAHVRARGGRQLFDAAETITWRAANLQPDDLKRLGTAPLKLWGMRTESPGLLLEKSANFFMKNGKSADR